MRSESRVNKFLSGNYSEPTVHCWMLTFWTHKICRTYSITLKVKWRFHDILTLFVAFRTKIMKITTLSYKNEVVLTNWIGAYIKNIYILTKLIKKIVYSIVGFWITIKLKSLSEMKYKNISNKYFPKLGGKTVYFCKSS